ncbi:hypothetical protein [uncultured Legionella sp.]|nr:hypothetical protein [uncultured Legionella sp.]
MRKSIAPNSCLFNLFMIMLDNKNTDDRRTTPASYLTVSYCTMIASTN